MRIASRAVTAAASGVLGLGIFVGAAPAHAATLYQSATYTGVDLGDYILSPNDFIGAAFHLTGETQITGIGGQFGANNGGSIFGTIVPLASMDAFPAAGSSDLASISLADTVFSVPNGAPVDLVTPLSVTLGPGFYGVIFGAGQFGSSSSAFAGLGAYNTPVGSPALFRSFFSNDWTGFDDDIRIVVEGNTLSAVPLPAALPLMGGAIAILGALAYRRRGAGVAAG